MDKATVMKALRYAGARLREPSTYLGLGAVLFSLHVADATTWASAITSIGIGVGGIVGILLPERAAPVAPAMTNPTTSALAIGIIVFALAAAAAPALAQEPRVPVGQKAAPVRTVPGTILPCDPANLLPGCRNADGTVNQAAGGQGNPFESLTDDLLKKILADVTYAQALAKASNNTVTQPCWDTWVKVVTAQTQPVVDGKGTALTLPDPHVFVAAERASEFINQLQPNSDLSIACAATLQASSRSIGQLIGAVLSGGALGLFKLP
jgi:hypothetical protein